MTHAISRFAPLALVVAALTACDDGKISLGASDTSLEQATGEGSGSSSDGDGASETSGGDGLACPWVEDEVGPDFTFVYENTLDQPIIVIPERFTCRAPFHVYIDSEDAYGSTSNVRCDVPLCRDFSEPAPLCGIDLCEEGQPLLLMPGGQWEETWDRSWWMVQDTPEGCSDEPGYAGVCTARPLFDRTAVVFAESVAVPEGLCGDAACECPDGATACLLDVPAQDVVFLETLTSTQLSITPDMDELAVPFGF